MSRTLLTSREIGSVQRNDLDIITTGEAVVRKLVAGTNITFSSTGVDAGTGDVTINGSGGGSGITRSINSISSTTTGAAVASTDYVYLCTGTFTYTQPTAVSNTNRYTIKNVSTGVVTITGTSSQTFDGGLTTTINPGSSIDLISDNTNWQII